MEARLAVGHSQGAMGEAIRFGPLVIGKRCRICGQCVEVCEQGVLGSHPGACDHCGVCEELCPQNAIHCTFAIVWDDDERARGAANGGSSA